MCRFVSVRLVRVSLASLCATRGARRRGRRRRDRARDEASDRAPKRLGRGLERANARTRERRANGGRRDANARSFGFQKASRKSFEATRGAIETRDRDAERLGEMSAEFTVAARALGRGSGTQGELTLSKAIGARFRAATGAGEQKKTEIEAGKVREVRWSDAPTGGVLRVRSTDGRTLVLGGMGTEDAKNAAEYAARELGCASGETKMNVNGRNWGDVAIEGSGTVFEVGGKTAFEIDGQYISEATVVGKSDVVLQFHHDDTAAEKDSLVEMSFYVPPGSETWKGDDMEDPDDTAAKRLHAAIMSIAAADAEAGEPVAEFDGVSMVVPRGKVSIELHNTHMRMQSSTLDFKVQYSSIVRVYLLPKPHSNQSHAVIALDPPIRKGQTFYPHILAMFNDDDHLTVEPNLAADMKDKFPTLESTYDGSSGEVFVRVLKNMAGVKLTRQSLFTASAGGHAIRVSHKADVGLLYPLEKAFFYLPKPPLLLHYSEVDEVEFERHSAQGATSGRTFDVSVNMKNGSSYDFHGIQRSEFQNLVNFLTAKQVRISNVDANARADQLIAEASDDDDEGYARRGDDDSEEDEDFAAGSESDGGEPTDSDSDSESDEGAKKSKKSPKAKRAKKDPNAPKRGLSAYMFFSAAKRAEITAANPSFGVTDVAKALGEKWKTITDEEKSVYQQQADEDKIRYEREMEAYRAGGSQPKVEIKDDDDSDADDAARDVDAMDED